MAGWSQSNCASPLGSDLTRITTDIRTNGVRQREGFGIIDSWKIIEKNSNDGRMVAIELRLSAWLRSDQNHNRHPDQWRAPARGLRNNRFLEDHRKEFQRWQDGRNRIAPLRLAQI